MWPLCKKKPVNFFSSFNYGNHLLGFNTISLEYFQLCTQKSMASIVGNVKSSLCKITTNDLPEVAMFETSHKALQRVLRKKNFLWKSALISRYLLSDPCRLREDPFDFRVMKWVHNEGTSFTRISTDCIIRQTSTVERIKDTESYGRRGSAALIMLHPFIRKGWH
jgi:hypothetical protein